MSDSFNSPNQLSLEASQESPTPESDVPAVNAQATDSISNSELEDLENDFDDLEAIKSSSSELIPEEEVSFEVIADYVEAEVAAETVTGATPDSVEVEGQTEMAPTCETSEADGTDMKDLEIDSETTFTNPEKQATESLNKPVESVIPNESGEASVEMLNDGNNDSLETNERLGTASDEEDLEVDAEEKLSEEITESFTAPVEVVDVEILESQEQERSYEVHQDGTLTYFQYFLDEEEAAFGAGSGDWRGETNASPRSFVSATAVGVGVLAATFGAGLLMAEATNRKSISDNQKDSAETQSRAEAERKASEASELAKASSPETTMPDWSATQKAIAVSEGSATANPNLGSLSSPSTSSVTSKLAPLAQSWGSSVPLPPPTIPIASPPVVTTASLPTPTTAPVDLSALQPVPSYQVIQPGSSSVSSTPLPNPPAVASIQQDEQQLRSRMNALRDRMASPVSASTVPVATDGSLLSGSDDRWVSNVPSRVGAPVNDDGTTLGTAFESPQLPSLTDSPYGSSTVASSPAAMPSSSTSVSTTAPRPIATAPQAYPLDLSPVVVPPHQASSLDEKIVAPVAGLLPDPVVPAQAKPLSPRASALPPHAVEQVAQTLSTEPAAETVQEPNILEVTPGAIALEVIPPAISSPVLTAPVSPAAATVENTASTAASQPSSQQTVIPAALRDMPTQGITSLTELTGIQSPLPLALSRDTARAALVNAKQLEQFRVLPLTVSEYQRLWQESGNDGTFAPVHGFVDYGQNVIAVVVTRGEVSEANSVAEEYTNLQPMGQATAPALTEVSAKPSVLVESLSQS